MGRRTERLSIDNLGDLPEVARRCVFYELDAVQRERARGREEEAKRAWVAQVLQEWGSCGRIVYVDDVYAGHVIWASAAMAPGTQVFATAPVSPDAVVVTSLMVASQRRGNALGKLLVQSMAKDVHRQGTHRAIECFASGALSARDTCTLPVAFWEAAGFCTHREHPAYPRMRMDLRSAATWREEVENAFGRLTAGMSRPASARRGVISR